MTLARVLRNAWLAGLALLAFGGTTWAQSAPCGSCGSCGSCASRIHCPGPYKYWYEAPPCIKFKRACPKPICDPCALEHNGYWAPCWQPYAYPPDWSHCPTPPPSVRIPPPIPSVPSYAAPAPAPRRGPVEEGIELPAPRSSSLENSSVLPPPRDVELAPTSYQVPPSATDEPSVPPLRAQPQPKVRLLN